MERLDLKQNPFQVRTPEDMHPEDVVRLFVERDFAPFFKVQERGHAMLVGPRGCGKSMIFRFMMPDCQAIYRKKAVRELDYFAVLIRFKNSAPNVTDLRRLQDAHAAKVLNEHMLTVYVAAGMFRAIEHAVSGATELGKAAESLFREYFEPLAREAGWSGSIPSERPAAGWLDFMASTCEEMSRAMSQYLRRISLAMGDSVPYRGPICGYFDFLLPIVRALPKTGLLPEKPFYLLLDDADYLSDLQTRILNTWIASRESPVSLKVSTQLQYKTFRTIDSIPIQAPHDFQEVDATDLYTNRSSYVRRIRDIVSRRLEAAQIATSPDQFFPPNKAQEDAIEAIREEFRAKPPRGPGGGRASDQVTRLARPEFFRRLAGPARNTPSYTYAGFEQLVHISSGIVRAFLESADKMFDEEKAEHPTKPVQAIPHGRQDQVVRKEADRLMFDELEKIAKGDEEQGSPGPESLANRVAKLNNLLKALGGTFRQKLISEDAERLVFSVAISGRPDPDVVEVFELGVQFGYFHRSTIGNKDGTGRQRLYVMTRRLAPHFSLDPSSFAGYLWMSNEKLREAIDDPDRFLRRVKEQGIRGAFDEGQLTLFESDGAES